MFGYGRAQDHPMAYDDEPVPPPTPAIQYYYPRSSKSKSSSSQRQYPTASASASSSAAQFHGIGLSGQNSILHMKASLVSGSHWPPASSSSSHQMEDMSPISPAAMIGHGTELLILPPSPQTKPRKGPNSASSSSGSTTKQPNQSHLEWLQQINAMAKQASTASIAHPQTMQHPPAMQTTAPNTTTHFPPPVSMHVAHPGYVAIAGGGAMYYAHAALTRLQQQPAEESEEKRAKRLERNRESARKSRRRKKERLSQLGDKVAGLHGKLEIERRLQINAMDKALIQQKTERMAQLRQEMDGDVTERLTTLVQTMGPNCRVRRSVVDFQYSVLKHMLLPRYQKFLLWLTLHPEQYFSMGKEEHAQREGKQVHICYALADSLQIVLSLFVSEFLTHGIVFDLLSCNSIVASGNDGKD
jgi:hypothetical protein